jgi:nucleotide-binding universal stress UspA family protein
MKTPATSTARRVLVLLECRPSDDAVLERAIDVAADSGGYLTLVVVVPPPVLWFCSGPYCAPRVTAEELHEQAERSLARAAASVPPDVPLITALDCGNTADVIARRVAVAAHDLVVVRRRRLRFPTFTRPAPAPVLAVAT